MDIALKFKRVVATVAAASLFASTASVAIAQTFNDVSTDAWYYTYVEQLVEDNVIDAADNYRPNDSLNRAEMVKMVIEATGGLIGYEAPASPTFDDVAVGAWYYDYVEYAAQQEIVAGYTDSVGNLTGMFGPADSLTRAAATKILVNAYSISTDLDPVSVFPDVTTGSWYYDYVVTAYNQSVLDGYENGYFGPGDNVTRAQVAKLVVNAPLYFERVVDEEEEEEDDTTSEGALEISLNDDTAASSTLPQMASSIDLFSFDVTAADDDVTISQVVVTRGGVGQASDWDALYLYDGAERLTTGRTINSDTNTATFAIDLLVEAGTTTTLRLVGDLVNACALLPCAGPSNQHYFYINSAADVTANTADLSGDFPTVGNLFTIGSGTTQVNGVTIVKGTAPTQPSIGEADAEIATFKLTAGATNDVALHQITLTQGGALSSDKMTNCTLLRSTDEVATADGFDGDRVTFVLDTPFVIPEGQSKTFYVNCDIEGGRTTDTISLYLDENTDLVAVDQQYGFGAVVTNTFGSGASNVLTLKGGAVTVVDNSPSAAQIAQNTTNNQVLAFGLTTDRDLTVRETYIKLEITDPTNVGPDLTAAMTTGVIAGTSGLANVDVTVNQTGWEVGDMLQVKTAAGTEYTFITGITVADTSFAVQALNGIPVAGQAAKEVNPYEYVKNVRLVDVDSGTTLAGPLTYANSNSLASAGVPTFYSKVHTEDYELTGGETRHLAVEVDLGQDIPANYRLKASVAYGDSTDVSGNSYLKDMSSNEYVKRADVVGAASEISPLGGKWMTAAANSLTIVKSATPTSYGYVKGDPAIPSLGFAMTAGDAGDITVKRLSVRVYANDITPANWVGVVGASNWTNVMGSIAANTIAASVTLYDGSDVVAGGAAKGLTLVDAVAGTGYNAGVDYFVAEFDDLDLSIPAGSTKSLVAKVALLNTMTATTYLAVAMDPGAMTAEDADANTITPVSAVGILNNVAAKNPLITINFQGALSVATNGEDSAILVEDTDDAAIATYTFTALKEGFDVNKLTIVNDTVGLDFGDNIVAGTTVVDSVTITFKDVYGALQTETEDMNAGIAKFSNLSFYVPVGDERTLTVKANINTLTDAGGELASGQVIRLGLQNTANTIETFEAVGASSSETDNFAGAPTASISDVTSLEPFVVRKTKPIITKATSLNANASVATTNNRLFGVTVTADSKGSVTLGRMVFKVSEQIAGDTLDEFKFYKGSTKLSGVAGKATIYEDGAGNIAEGGAAMTNGGADVVVALIEPETIPAGESVTFYLDADTTLNTVVSTDSIVTRISADDDATPPPAPRSSIYSAAISPSLTTLAADYVADALASTPGADFIWSDRSAELKTYTTFAGVLTVTDTSSLDWTNGYLLKLTEVASHSID